MRALGALLLFITLALAGCANAPSEDDHGSAHAAEKLFPDVHGLAYDAESRTLWVATHTGLQKRVADGAWERVGPQQDLMGFSRDPTAATTFWASGHPATGGNLGAIRSTDGGATWTAVGAAGADFHAMAATNDGLYGSFRGAVHRSTDGGVTWEQVALLSAAAFASVEGALVASTGTDVRISEDAGESWRALATLPAYGLAAADRATLYVGAPGGIQKTEDGGSTWTTIELSTGQRAIGHLHVDPDAPATVHAASYDGFVWRSDDAGVTWRAVSRS